MKSVLIVGCGNMGVFYDFHDMNLEHPRSHLTAYLGNSNYKIAGLVDSDLSKLKLIQSKFNIGSTYENMTALPKDLKFDVVSLATSTSSRLNIMAELVNRTSLIFCEKPLAATLAEALEIQKLIKNSQTTLLLNYSRRWNQKIRDVFSRVQSGEFGTIKKINSLYTKGLVNNGSHQIDLLHMLGCKVQAVQTISEAVPDSFIESTFSFNLQMNGPQNEQFISTHTALNYQEYTTFEIDILMSSGRIEIKDSGNHIKISIPKADSKYVDYSFLNLIEEFNDTQKDVLKNAVDQIFNVLDNKEIANCTLTDGIKSLTVAEALKFSFEKPYQWHEVSYPIDPT